MQHALPASFGPLNIIFHHLETEWSHQEFISEVRSIYHYHGFMLSHLVATIIKVYVFKQYVMGALIGLYLFSLPLL